MLNCIYDCEYCFLQGKHMSAHYLLFINYEDFMYEIEQKIKKNKLNTSYFFSGYDCDSLALEGITGFVNDFIPFFKKKNAILELRTKSTQINSILKYNSIDNCIVAFSFTPENISKVVEHGVPSVKKRILAMKTLADKGWKIGLRFDPIIPACNFTTIYEKLIKDIASVIPQESVHSVSFGMMRFPKKMYKKMKKDFSNERILSLPIVSRKGLYSYPEKLENKLSKFVSNTIKKYFRNTQIYNCKI